MAYTLKYNPPQLRAAASQMRTYAYSHMDAIDRIVNLVNGLPDVWEGVSERKLLEVFEQMETSFDQFDEALEAFAKALEGSADAMEEADRRLLRKIGSIG